MQSYSRHQMQMNDLLHAQSTLPQRKQPTGTYLVGSWVDLNKGLLRLPNIEFRIFDGPAGSLVTRPTQLFRLPCKNTAETCVHIFPVCKKTESSLLGFINRIWRLFCTARNTAALYYNSRSAMATQKHEGRLVDGQCRLQLLRRFRASLWQVLGSRSNVAYKESTQATVSAIAITEMDRACGKHEVSD